MNAKVCTKELTWIDRSETWMDPLVGYWCDGALPQDP